MRITNDAHRSKASKSFLLNLFSRGCKNTKILEQKGLLFGDSVFGIGDSACHLVLDGHNLLLGFLDALDPLDEERDGALGEGSGWLDGGDHFEIVLL